MYTVDYFIKKFEAIPEGKWYQGSYHDESKNRFCAYGHCGIKVGCCGEKTEADALSILFRNLDYPNSDVAGVNDGFCIEYKQPTPKQRILAALYDIKKLTKDNSITPKTEFSPVTFSEIKETILLSNS